MKKLSISSDPVKNNLVVCAVHFLSTAETRWAAVSKTSMPINTEICFFSLHIEMFEDKCHTERDNNQDMYDL